MYSYNPESFVDSDVCNKCSVFAALEMRLGELEAGIANGAISLASGGRYQSRSPTVAGRGHQQRTQNGWEAVTRGKRSSKHKHKGPPPVHVSNTFSPLADTSVECVSENSPPIDGTVTAPIPAKHATEIKTLVIGSSIMRNVAIKTSQGKIRHDTKVKCFPGARAGDIESDLKMMKAKDKDKRYDKIIIHCGGNDTRRKRSEVTKINIESVCTFAKTMSDNVIFSGPLPDMTDDEMYSRMSSFNRWLSRWCPDNNINFINHWKTFEGKAGLMGRDGIHPTWDGAALISRNMELFINNP